MPKDIHDTERSCKTGLETFQKDSRISAYNKGIFAKFLEGCKIGYFGEAVGTARLSKYLYHYKQVCIWLGKDIQKENGPEVFLAKMHISPCHVTSDSPSRKGTKHSNSKRQIALYYHANITILS